MKDEEKTTNWNPERKEKRKKQQQQQQQTHSHTISLSMETKKKKQTKVALQSAITYTSKTKTTPPFTNDWLDLAHDSMTMAKQQSNKRKWMTRNEEKKKDLKTHTHVKHIKKKYIGFTNDGRKQQRNTKHRKQSIN